MDSGRENPRRGDDRYRALVEASAQVVWVATSLGSVVEDLPSWRAFTGQTFEQLKGFGWLNAIHPHDRDRVADVWKQSLAKARPHEQEFRLRGADGRYRDIAARAVPIKDLQGKVIEWVGTCSDLTRQRAADQAIRESETRLRAVTDAIPHLIWTAGPDGHIEYCNRRWLRYTGLTLEEAQGEGWLRSLHPDDRGRVQGAWQRATQNESDLEVEERLRGADGTYRWFLARSTPLRDAEGHIIRWYGTCTDIERRKRAEEMAHDANELLDLAQRAAEAGVWDFNVATGQARWSRQCHELFGTDPVSFAPSLDAWTQRIHPEDRTRVMDAVQDSLASRREFNMEFRIHHPTLGIRWLWELGNADYDPDGRPTSMAGIALDITERRRVEESLRRSEEGFRQLADAMPQVVWTAQPDGRVDYFNARWHQYTGLTHEQSRDWGWGAALHPDDLPAAAQAWTTALRDGTPYVAEYRFRRASDGATRWHLARALPVRDAAGQIAKWFGTVTDIHDLKEVEQQLLAARQAAEQASRAKDHFLAVLSHELRTPLTPVVMTVAALEAEPGLPPHLKEDLAMIRRNIALETRLIDDLLDISRIINGKMTLHPQNLDVHALMRSVAEMMASEVRGKRLSIHWDLRADDDRVRADGARLQQVLWNLFKNAIKFTPEGGAITLRTWNDSPRQMSIQIEDTGVGIDPDALPRIFNAFDQGETGTTRRFGGLGLGLTISKAIVEMHGGVLRAESAGRGEGARLTVDMPTIGVVERIVNRIESPGKPGRGQSRRLRVLLVEDHPDTMKMLRRLLEISGYAVTAAGSVSAAMALIEAHEFDILVSDIGLPDGTGIELVRQMRSRNLAIPGVAITGYGMDQDVQSCFDAGFAAHLTKPVDFDSLEATMRRVLQVDAV